MVMTPPTIAMRENNKIYKVWLIKIHLQSSSIPRCFGEIRRLLSCKKYQHHALPSFSSKGLYLRKWKPNYLIFLQFGNTSFNYLHVLVKTAIFSYEADVAGMVWIKLCNLVTSARAWFTWNTSIISVTWCLLWKVCCINWFQDAFQSIQIQHIFIHTQIWIFFRYCENVSDLTIQQIWNLPLI